MHTESSRGLSLSDVSCYASGSTSGLIFTPIELRRYFAADIKWPCRAKSEAQGDKGRVDGLPHLSSITWLSICKSCKCGSIRHGKAILQQGLIQFFCSKGAPHPGWAEVAPPPP